MEHIFISSVRKELAAEQRALKDYIHGSEMTQMPPSDYQLECLRNASNASCLLDETEAETKTSRRVSRKPPAK